MGSAMKTDELLPCPFCGGDADLFKCIDGAWSTWILECVCGIEMRFISKEEAIKAWNRRVTDGE